MRIAMNRDSSKKLNFHQIECAAWWISEHSSEGEQLAYIQRGGGSSPSVPISKAREQLCWIPQSFHSFLRKSSWQNGTMTAVGVILKVITTERFSKREGA